MKEDPGTIRDRWGLQQDRHAGGDEQTAGRIQSAEKVSLRLSQWYS